MAEWRGDEGDDFFDQCIGCHGVWVDWWSGEASGIARRVPARPGSAPTGTRGGVCPRDGTELVEREYLDTGPVVERCPTCLGLFARREQIGELASFHERIPMEPPEPIVWVSWLDRVWHTFLK
jgi:Zn-finger nucleic acid-binding protein